jgi:hypothetical protein
MRFIHRSLTLLVAVAALSLVAPAPSHASVARRMHLQEMVATSSTIVLAHCESARSAWTPDRSQIVTVAVYQAMEVFKGAPAHRFSVVTLGGVVDGVGQHVSGMPAFQPGRQEILFLTSGDGARRVVGMAQGQFIVAPAKTGGGRIVRDLRGLSLFGADDPSLAPRSLDDFRATLKALAR